MKVFVLALSVTLISWSSAVILQPKTLEGVIPGKYIVKLRSGVNPEVFVNAKSLRSSDGALVSLKKNVEFTYTNVLNGFSCSLDNEQLQALDASPEVEFIEPDMIATAFGTQNNAPWGLARSSSRSRLPASGPYTYDYPDSAGEGVDAYILDTGIRITHQDFGTRARFGANYVGGSDTDGNGHGTHCAGTVGGNTYGIAKKCNLVAVKVLSDSGSGAYSGIISGINYAAGGTNQRRLISMSLGGGRNTALDTACTDAYNRGTVVVAAAGNSNNDACGTSPAGALGVKTVAAMNVQDAKASFSSYGPCVDIWAPGQDVLSAWYTSDTATNTISGTSMACPHVAGIAALHLNQLSNPSPVEANRTITAACSEGQVTGVPANTKNLLANVEFKG